MIRRPSLRIATLAVLAGCALLVAALANTPGPTASDQTGTDPDRASQGGGAELGDTPFHPIELTDQNRPRPEVLTHPNQLSLKAAESRVFDVKSLTSNVEKVERSENEGPGEVDLDAPSGSDVDADSDSESDAVDDPTEPGGKVDGDQSEAAAAPGPSANFAGLDYFNWGAGHPPDPNGDVGPTYYIQTINTAIGIFNKSSGNRVAAFTFNALMSQGHFGNLCDTDNFGDPVVLYDTYEDRWFITDFAFELDNNGNVSPQTVYQCFAVSKTGDPVAGGWNFYSILDPGGLGDYPKFGVWPDGIYMSANMFNYAGTTFTGTHVWAINKQQMYANAPTVQVVDFGQGTSDFTLLPANSRLQTGTPPTGRPEYFVSTERYLNALAIYKFQVNWTNTSASTFSGPFPQDTPDCWPDSQPANAATPANALDTLGVRAMAQAQYASIDGAESLWIDHTVNRGVFSLASCNHANANNATLRWYQANVTGGTIASDVVQGTTYDPEGANTYYRFAPSLAVDRAGDAAIGYSKSNASTNPQIKYAGRLAGDAPNTLGQTEQTLFDGSGTQSGSCGGPPCQRWGDYTGMALDPNGCAFWMTNEYYATNGLNFLTRIGSFSFPSCAPVGNGTLSGTVTDGTNPIAGATVSLGSRSTTTNGSGAYSFSVAAGTYPSEVASAPGFTPLTVTMIDVPSGGSAIRNFVLTGTSATTTLAVSPATGSYGGTATLTATLKSGANAVVGKSVSFKLSGTTVGSASTNSSGVATVNNVSLAGIPVGNYPTGVSASWAGDGSFASSSGSAQLSVSQASSSVSVLGSSNPSVFTQPVSFTANVTSSGGTPTGTVQFRIGGTNFGSPVAVDGTGKATSSATTTLTVASHTISAVYSGDTNFSTSTGSTSQTVDKANVTVTLTSSANPVKKGASITFTVTVASASPATKVPGGKVKLFKNGKLIKNAHTLSGGKAMFTFSWTYKTGTFSMTAKYLGTANFNVATSPVYSQLVTN
ncbi:MAG TPA: Ig-like domain repeat protein [Candidatus Limnocylindrales bacterium]